MTRNTNGTFAKGNAFGRGRPPRETEREFLDCLVASVPLAQWKKIVKQAVEDAMGGDPKAREWLSKYLLPAPGEPDEQPPQQYIPEPPPDPEIARKRLRDLADLAQKLGVNELFSDGKYVSVSELQEAWGEQ